MKHIIVQSLPHTGTHTMLYLFHVLGGLPVMWHHWHPTAIEHIKRLLQEDTGDILFVQTHREEDSMIASYVRRGDDAGIKHYEMYKEVYDEYAHLFPAVTFPIEANDLAKSSFALQIFRLMETDIPPPALRYMRRWGKINSFLGGKPSGNQGYLNDDHWNNMNKTLQKSRLNGDRVTELFKGEDNGT